MEKTKNNKNENYTTMRIEHLKDNRLSLEAKGLLSIYYSLAVGEDFSENKEKHLKAIMELEKYGYIKIKKGKKGYNIVLTQK